MVPLSYPPALDPPRGAGQRPASDILVVDDTPENLSAIEAALDGLGTTLVLAPSGTDALRHLLARDFALILLDVNMPGMNGLETAQMIRSRERNRHVPIIFVTAYDRKDDDILRAYRLGAVDFLFKPVQPEMLRAKVAVFVELQRRAAQVALQANQLRHHARSERERALAEQRRYLEAEALRQRLEEQKRHAAELESMNQRLADDDRRKDEFIAVLAHELRNPLTPLVAGLELFHDAAQHDATLGTARQAMQRQVEHLVRLVDDLLDMSRITRGKVELRRTPVRLPEIVDQAVSFIRPYLNDLGHELALPDEVADVVVDGDDVRLAQVLANLLNNAARYTPPGGRVSLDTVLENGGIWLRVRDNGRGIPPALVDRVFDLFVQERAGGGGLGIGLTLVKQLVEMHGGRVSASSDGPGHGSEFAIWLPLASAELAAPRRADTADVSPIGPQRIALIEDNEDIRTLMGHILRKWGHEVLEAGAGRDGVDLLTRTRPDLAIVDIGLPDIDGYQVAREVHAALGEARPRLVALSGFSQARDRERARDAGFDEHLAKPACAKQLGRLLRMT